MARELFVFASLEGKEFQCMFYNICFIISAFIEREKMKAENEA
jgi:hypothetical protein